MALTVEQAREIVNIVASDSECGRRINSVLKIVPPQYQASGFIRNTLITVGFDMVPDILDTYGIQKRKGMQSDEFRYHCCNGIADAVMDVFSHHRKLPFIKSVSKGDSKSTDHTAPQFAMTAGGEYVFDWWLTLDIRNPILWRKADWEQFTNPAFSNKGTQYRYFEGFDL
jgi:hypothetical protein